MFFARDRPAAIVGCAATSAMSLVSPEARISNALGDGLLCVAHLCFLYKAATVRVSAPRAVELRYFVLAYFLSLALFQLQGAWIHVASPTYAEADRRWLAYLAAGALSPCLYGAALSQDQLRGATARRLASLVWVTAGLGYVAVAAARVDLADFLPLPASLTVTLPAYGAHLLRNFRWMQSALRLNGLQRTVPGARALNLTFDGRGYAATPFARIFDAEYAGAVDLVASFPCWRTESLGTLMLCFGVGANFVHLFIACRGRDSPSASAERRGRAASVIRSHAGMFAALVTMPLAMMLGGVPCGIDWMHACAAPGMYLQAKACAEAIAHAEREATDETPPDTKLKRP